MPHLGHLGNSTGYLLPIYATSTVPNSSATPALKMSGVFRVAVAAFSVTGVQDNQPTGQEFGQIVSQLGDWFNSVAIYALLLELTGNATSVALMIIVQFLPMAVIGPVAGVMVDRVNRRRLMIATDVLRGLAVLVLLTVRRPDQVWLVYVVMGTVVSMTAFFEPARTAVIPNVTTRSQLLTANALSSATWSAMLAIGAGVGGIVTALVLVLVATAVWSTSCALFGTSRVDTVEYTFESADLPPAFDALVKPEKTLLFSPQEVEQNRRAWIDEWLNALAK